MKPRIKPLFITLPLLLVLGVILAGCAMPQLQQEGGGSIAVLPAMLLTRTLYPTDIQDSIELYRISFTGPETVEPAIVPKEIYLTSGYVRDNLAVGVWEVWVQGLDSGDAVIAEGSSSVSVSANATTSVSIELHGRMSPDTSGSIDIILEWAGTDIDSINSVEASLAFQDGVAESISFVLDVDGHTARHTGSYPAGSYFLNASLMDGAILVAPYSVAIQIFDNLTTRSIIALVQADFNSPPAAPTSLAVTGGVSAKGITLSWMDNATVETRYVIERSLESASGFLVIKDDLPANSTYWKDDSAGFDITYYYRVMAVNDFGSSDAATGDASWARSSAKSITAFSFSDTGLSGTVCTIDEEVGTITAMIPWMYRQTFLAVNFTASAEALVSVAGRVQTSGVTAVDFAYPVTYTVTAEDTSTRDYTVTITFTPSEAIGIPGTTAYLSGPIGSGGAGYADGTGAAAQFNKPWNVWSNENDVFVTDSENHTVRRINRDTWEVTTLAGLAETEGDVDGVGGAARLAYPGGITGLGDFLYIIDGYGVKKIQISTGTVSIMHRLNTNPAASAQSRYLGITNNGTDIFFCQYDGVFGDTFYGIRKLTQAGDLSDIAGSSSELSNIDGTGTGASFYNPRGLVYTGSDSFYLVDVSVSSPTNGLIRKLVSDGTAGAGIVTTAMADISPVLISPVPLAQLAHDGTSLFIADSGSLATIRKMALSDHSVTVLSQWSASEYWSSQGLFHDGTHLYVTSSNHLLKRFVQTLYPSNYYSNPTWGALEDLAGSLPITANEFADGAASVSRYNSPRGMVEYDGHLYVADSVNHRIRKVSKVDGSVTTIAGNGTYQSGLIASPSEISFDGKDFYILNPVNPPFLSKMSLSGVLSPVKTFETDSVSGIGAESGLACDGGNFYISANYDFNGTKIHRILRIDRASLDVTVLAGGGINGNSDGVGTDALFYHPRGLARDGKYLYVADWSNQSVRKIDLETTEVSTLATDIWANSLTVAENHVYATAGNQVWRIAKVNGGLGLVAGNPTYAGSVEGMGEDARFSAPKGIWYDGSKLFVVDTGNHKLRVIE